MKRIAWILLLGACIGLFGQDNQARRYAGARGEAPMRQSPQGTTPPDANLQERMTKGEKLPDTRVDGPAADRGP